VKLIVVSGIDDRNDLLAAEDQILYISDETGFTKQVRKVDFAPAVPAQVWASVIDPATTRLSLVSGTSFLLVSRADDNKIIRLDTGTGGQFSYRIPGQIFPVGLAAKPDGSEVYLLNYLSNTVSIIDTAVVITAGAPPAHTAEPPVTLSAYRQQIIDAYKDLLMHLAQHIKDGFCERFLVDCEDCRVRPEVYLGVVEIENERIKHICNFTERHYVKSFRTYGYWLSAFPILPLFKKVWKELCCLII
jgi:YVTN family beta-propeller protein